MIINLIHNKMKHPSFTKAFLFIIVLWILFLGQINGLVPTDSLGTYKGNGLLSILTGPLLHGNFRHLAGNSVILLVCLTLLLDYYKKYSDPVIILGYIVPSLSCYFLDMRVIGISGLVFAALWFLILAGLASKDKYRKAIAIVLALFNATALIGITPAVSSRVAWEAHLVGFLVSLCVVIYKLYIKKSTIKTN